MNLAICGILFRRVAAVCVRHPGIVRIDAKNELRGWAVWLTIFWLVAAGQSAWAQASMTLNISPAHPTDTDSRTLAQSETASLTINVAAKGMANGVNYILKSGPDFTLDSTSPEFVWTGARGSYWIVNTSPQSAVASVTARCVWTPAPPSGGGLAKGGYSPPLPPDIEGLAVGTAFALPGGEYWNEADTNILCVYETTLVRAYENDEPAESDWSIAGPGEILGATNGVDTVVVKGTEASTSMWDLVVTSVSCASGASDTEYLTVVGVKGLEYWRVKERVWAELPEPLCVGLGANVYFRVLKQPAVAPWPAGKPVWEGAIGSGERADKIFDTVSDSTTDYKIVTAECGNTVTGKVIVLNVEIDYNPNPPLVPYIANNTIAYYGGYGDCSRGLMATVTPDRQDLNISFQVVNTAPATDDQGSFVDLGGGYQGDGQYAAIYIAKTEAQNMRQATDLYLQQQYVTIRATVNPSGFYAEKTVSVFSHFDYLKSRQKYDEAIDFVSKKYGIDIVATYDSGLDARGKTTFLGDVTIGPMAMASENLVASTLIHEKKHVDQGPVGRTLASFAHLLYIAGSKSHLDVDPWINRELEAVGEEISNFNNTCLTITERTSYVWDLFNSDTDIYNSLVYP